MPERIALHFGERSWSYRELDLAAGRVVARLLGLEPGDRVAAYVHNSDSSPRLSARRHRGPRVRAA